jgi:starch-binding outer membrane protein, SusD/RagB family
MKILIKSTLFATLAFGILGCEKTIDKTPTHLASAENAFKSVDDYEKGLSAIYDNLREVGYYGRNMSIIPDMMGDGLVQTGESLVNFLTLTDWAVTPGFGTVEETWLRAYRVVNHTNIIINNILKVTTTANQKQANRILGQAFAIRAMAHFDIMKYWSDNLDRASTLAGIPYVKTSVLETSPAASKPARISVKEVYDNIYADIAAAKTAFANIDAAINPATNRYKVDLIGLNAIEARVALYAKDYTTAVNASTVVINALPLATSAVYPSIFKDQSNAEVAFAVTYSSGEFLSRVAGDVYSPPINRSQWEGAPSLFAQFDEANDVRFGVNVRRGYGTLAAPARTNDRFTVVKHLGKGTAIDGVVDWKAFRTGEMYLIRAEARALTSQAALALADLNTLRAARINGFIAGVETGSALIDAIALERRKELFMEGHRWFDLKRTTRTINRGVIAAPTTQSVLAPTRREWVWPIPTAEIDANPNMKQNTGY